MTGKRTVGRVVGWGVAAAALMGFWGLRDARAEHFDINLAVITATGRGESGWDTHPPVGGLNSRQSVKGKAGEEIRIEWQIRSEFPHGVMKDTAVRLYVAPEKEPGQKDEPPAASRVLESTFTADFHPKHMARGHLYFRPTQPGIYLVRLESDWTLREHGHEHFGAVDLVIE